MKCNRKCTTLQFLHSSLSITVIRAKVSKRQIKLVCYDKEENFTLCGIMQPGQKIYHFNSSIALCKQVSGLMVTKRVRCQKL